VSEVARESSISAFLVSFLGNESQQESHTPITATERKATPLVPDLIASSDATLESNEGNAVTFADSLDGFCLSEFLVSGDAPAAPLRGPFELGPCPSKALSGEGPKASVSVAVALTDVTPSTLVHECAVGQSTGDFEEDDSPDVSAAVTSVQRSSPDVQIASDSLEFLLESSPLPSVKRSANDTSIESANLVVPGFGHCVETDDEASVPATVELPPEEQRPCHERACESPMESPPVAIDSLPAEGDDGSSTEAFPQSSPPLSDYGYASDGAEPYMREYMGSRLFHRRGHGDESESQSEALRSDRCAMNAFHDSSYAYFDDE
jgi:hypothetical protein